MLEITSQFGPVTCRSMVGIGEAAYSPAAQSFLSDYFPPARRAFALGISQVPFIINFIGSWIWGKPAPGNPWEATTLEWNDTTSPPPHGNFAKVPVVHHGPYEYSSPLVEEDWLPQTRYVEGAEALAMKH